MAKNDRHERVRAFRLAAQGKIEKGKHHKDPEKKPEGHAHKAFMQTVKRTDAVKLDTGRRGRSHQHQ